MLNQHKNSLDTTKSRSWKIALWAFVASLIYIAIGLIQEITIGDKTFKFNPVDASVILALLAPSFSLYGVRRYTSAKYEKKSNSLSQAGHQKQSN